MHFALVFQDCGHLFLYFIDHYVLRYHFHPGKFRPPGLRLPSDEKMKAKKEVKNNKIAKKEFKRIYDLLANIEKNDALYENVINRYAMLYAECQEFEEKRERFYDDMIKLEKF